MTDAHANAHYHDVNHGWPTPMPPCSREEAQRAANKIMRYFTRHPLSRHVRVRRCWIAASPPYDTLHRGWRRLAHDLSHDIFRKRNSQHAATVGRRPHDPAHVRVEREVMAFILARGFLDGRLKPQPKARPAVDKHAKLDAAEKRWTTKLRRAQTALKKLARQRSALRRAEARAEAAAGARGAEAGTEAAAA